MNSSSSPNGPPFEAKVRLAPPLISPRVVAQNGLFTVHFFDKGRERFIPVEEDERLLKKLTKVAVERFAVENLRSLLGRCGIHEAGMFPDLDGLVRGLNAKYGFAAPFLSLQEHDPNEHTENG